MPKFNTAYKTLALSAGIAKLQADAQALAIKALADSVQAMAAAIPVYSGESRASLIPAAKLLGVKISIFPVAASKVAQGIAQGSARLEIGQGKFDLVYESKVDQLDTNNRFNMNRDYPQFFKLRQPGPYNYPAIGRETTAKVFGDGIGPIISRFFKLAQRVVN